MFGGTRFVTRFGTRFAPLVPERDTYQNLPVRKAKETPPTLVTSLRTSLPNLVH